MLDGYLSNRYLECFKSGIDMAHFRRWRALFEAHVRRLFGPELEEQFLVVARRIAASLQYGYVGRAKVA